MALLAPMQKRRAEYTNDKNHFLSVLQKGATKANAITNKTLHDAKEFMKQVYS